jgi:hypothetical protein
MKNAVFWDVAPCRSCVNRRFGGTYGIHLHGKKIRERGTTVSRWLQTEPQVENTQPAATCSHWFLARAFFYPEDVADNFLRNVGSRKIYTASHPRRQHSSLQNKIYKIRDLFITLYLVVYLQFI